MKRLFGILAVLSVLVLMLSTVSMLGLADDEDVSDVTSEVLSDVSSDDTSEEDSDVSVFVEPDTYEDHLIYSFDFDGEDATTVLKKAGSTPGVIDREVYAGDAETGGSLALQIGPNSTTGRGGVLPYIWPEGISGVINAQGDLKEGEYYEFQIDMAWDGPLNTKKGTYVYPFMLINGKSENYFTKVSEGIQQIGEEFQTYVYRVDTLEATPKKGEDSGGIAFCCENSLAYGGYLRFDNIKLIKHGEWVPADTSGIHYVTPVVAPTTYEETDENGVTASGKITTVLYENDFESAKPESIFGHYNDAIDSHILTQFEQEGKGGNNTKYEVYFIPSSSTPNTIYSDGGYYPVIWMYNSTLKEIFANEKPLQADEYYLLQVSLYCSQGYCYPSIICGDKEYSPVYEWDSTNMSENISSFGAQFITRYYVFKKAGMDLSKGNCAIAFFTEGYLHSFVPVYADNFKLSVVRFPEKSIVWGDVSGDEKVDMIDVLMTRRYMAHMITEEDLDFEAGDIDKNGKLDMKDVLYMRKYMAHMIEL